MKTPYLKHFQFFDVLMLVENTGVICIQIRACSDNDWGRSFTNNRKRRGPRIKPCGTTYFKVPVSEKHYQYKPKIFYMKERTQTI